uniref:Uncharacterized protein n=1 Tax=Anguilla anguilla TaxID=7936 RepID=A0A0E9SFV5_ANGAN
MQTLSTAYLFSKPKDVLNTAFSKNRIYIHVSLIEAISRQNIHTH